MALTPNENVIPIPVRAPPPGYAPVHGQRAVRGRPSRSFCPYRFPYADHVNRRLARKDLLAQGAKLDIIHVKTVLKLFRKEQKLFAFSYHHLFYWKLKCYLPSNHLRNLEICS